MSLIKETVFALKNDLFRSHATRFYRQLERDQYVDSDTLSNINWKKRLNMIEFAAKNTKLYRELFKSAGIEDVSNLTPEDYCNLPILTRDKIKNRFGDIIADDARPSQWTMATTGGSTGRPLSVLQDRRVPQEAAWWRVSKWWGVEPSDDIAFIYRFRRTGLRAFANDIMWWPTRRLFLDASMMTEKSILLFVKKYNAISPSILEGYVGAVYEFALFCRSNGVRIHSPKAVWVTAAPLAEPQREVMQSVFGAPVYDQYGSCEIGWIACECKERNGLHLMSDIRHVDIVDDDGKPVTNGEWGRILVTDLENRVFPLIRYEIGDRGRYLTRICPCGVNLPLIDKIRGRISDVIRLPDGGSVSGEYLTTIFDKTPDAVVSFQIKQESNYSLDLLCVLGSDPKAKDTVETVAEKLRILVKNAFPVRVAIVKEIPHDRGKTRFIISKVNPRN